MAATAAFVLIVVMIAAWLSTLVGIPGNWLMVVAAIVYAWQAPAEWPATITWSAVIALAVLALAAEVLEFVAGAWGASRAGGSRRGAALAILGSIVGGLAGAAVGVPIPLVGPIVGALFFAALGAMVGAMAGEHWKGREMDASWRVGKAAFWGRLVGTGVKMAIGAVMLIVVLASLFLRGF